MNIQLKLFKRLIALEAEIHGKLLDHGANRNALSLSFKEQSYEFKMEYEHCATEVTAI